MPIALITGATSGFGRAIALKLAQNNWDVIITGRRLDRLKELEEKIVDNFKTNVLSLAFDIRNKDEVHSAIATLDNKWKEIEVLVNNAGLASGLSAIQDGDVDDWEKMIDTNLKGLLYISKEVMNGMVNRKSGHIVNIGSIAGKEVYAKGNVYCATKHAVDAISKSMRIDMLPFGVKVTAIHPGAAETEFSLVRFHGDEEKAEKVYQGYQPLVAEDIADVVFYAITRPRHVVLNDIVITPLAQANTANFIKDNTL